MYIIAVIVCHILRMLGLLLLMFKLLLVVCREVLALAAVIQDIGEMFYFVFDLLEDICVRLLQDFAGYCVIQ